MAVNKGREGELLFQQQMESKGYVVQDVSADPQYYYKGDMIVTSPTTGLTKTFEVKYDYRIHKTGNLYLELANKNSQGCCGWYEFTKADYVAYGDAINKKFYIIHMDKLRERVAQLPKRLASCQDDSTGQIVSLQQLSGIYEIL